MKTESQTKNILEYMLNGCKITALEALRLFGCLNLKGRIWDIKNDYGIEPDRQMIPVKTKYGTKHVMQYFFKNPKSIKL